MAGDWIKVEIATSNKPEVWAIAEILSLDPDAVVGKLFRVWSWFDQHTVDGNAPSVTKTGTLALLDRSVNVTGFCQAMISVGWMIDNGDTLELPNFERHNGKTAKNRGLTAKRVAEHKRKGNANANDKVTQGALPREDKRREDKREGEGGSAGETSPPPTLEEVRAECEQRGYQGLDPSQWWAYWDSVAWCDRNGRPIKWRSRLMSDALSPKPSWRIEAEKLAKTAKAASKSQYKPLTSD